MDEASEGLFALKPVTFRYKQEFDPSHKLSFGLIAEEVAKVSANLVSHDKDGKPQGFRFCFRRSQNLLESRGPSGWSRFCLRGGDFVRAIRYHPLG